MIIEFQRENSLNNVGAVPHFSIDEFSHAKYQTREIGYLLK
jgi:hypothetical protein